MDRAVTEFGAAQRPAWTTDQLVKAKRICYRTVWTECDWRNWANPTVPGSETFLPNDGFPKTYSEDSVGLYQQRAKWWGSTEGSMSPYTATGRFLAAMLRDAPDWFTTTDEAVVCQKVQRSQFDGVTVNPATGKPYVFAQNYRDRTAQTLALEGDLLYFQHITAGPRIPVQIPYVLKR